MIFHLKETMANHSPQMLRRIVRLKNMSARKMLLLLGIGLAKKAVVLVCMSCFTCV